MRVKLHTLLISITLVVLSSVTATAGAPQRISYQGRLMDATGSNPVPDNPALQVIFNIYSAGVGPGSLWNETQNVDVKNGLFSAELGAVTPLPNSIFSDSTRWLGVTVGGTELTPRTRLVSAPYCYRVATLVGTSGGTVNGTIYSGSSAQSGEVRVYSNGSVNPVVKVTRSTNGGAVDAYDEAGNFMAGFQADVGGVGGYLYTYRDAGTQGFTVDGNFGSSEETRVIIAGSSQSANFRMDQTGDAAVVFPVDAINSTEMSNEPGVASNGNPNFYELTGSLEVLLSRTITLPAAGYVLTIATCQPIVSHTNGTTSAANFGVSTSSSSLPSNQDIGIWLPSTLPTGSYNFPVTPQAVFSLSAGTHTLYLLGDQLYGAAGSIDAYDMQLSLIYIPTSYGTVSTAELAASTDDKVVQAGTVTIDPERERQESTGANNARIAKELAAMKAELEAVKRHLEQGNQPSEVK